MGAPLYLRVHVYFEIGMDSSVYHFGHFDPSSTPYLVMYFTQIARKTIYFWNIGFAHSIDKKTNLITYSYKYILNARFFSQVVFEKTFSRDWRLMNMSYKIESNGSVYTPVQQMEQPFIDNW